MNDLLIALAIIALATAIATDYILLPFAAFSSPIAIFIILIAAVGAFQIYPAAGFALFLLTAVLFFKRNTHALFDAKTSYGDVSIMGAAGTTMPYMSDKSGPREYDQFNETDRMNPMLGPLREGFSTAEGVAAPAPFETESGAPLGEYPIEEERPSESSVEEVFTYRPEPETGSNEFVRFGPDIDEKKNALAY